MIVSLVALYFSLAYPSLVFLLALALVLALAQVLSWLVCVLPLSKVAPPLELESFPNLVEVFALVVLAEVGFPALV